MNKVYLLLGSNMGNSKQQLAEAIKNIKRDIGKITRESNLYVTAAWGNTNQPDFLNQVIVVETKISALQTIKSILAIEKKMGRVPCKRFGPRLIDIDILYYDDLILQTPTLTIPRSTRPVTTVPRPEIENTSSIGIRNGRSTARSGCGM